MRTVYLKTYRFLRTRRSASSHCVGGTLASHSDVAGAASRMARRKAPISRKEGERMAQSSFSRKVLATLLGAAMVVSLSVPISAWVDGSDAGQTAVAAETGGGVLRR